MIPKFFLILAIGCVCLSCDRNRPVQSATAYKPITPVFTQTENNPVIRINLNIADSSGAALSEIALQVSDSTQGLIRGIHVFYTGRDSTFKTKNLFGKVTDFNQTPVLEGKQKLQKGENYLWVSIELTPEATLLDHINISANYAVVDNQRIQIHSNRKEVSLKTAIKLREAGEDGVHTYRIPGLVTTNKGTLIAVYDVRYEADSGDLQGDIDVGMSRSTDKGKTWEPMQIIMDKGTWGGLPENQNGVGDPAILVDRATNTIWVAALWAHGHEGERILNVAGPGFKPIETGQLLLVKSEDDGKTWSELVNITRQIKKKKWHISFDGPGSGITMKNGTLVFAGQYWDENGIPHSTIIYSKDHGKTWHIGTGAKPNTTEAQVVQLSDGSLMLNMRDNRGGSRSVFVTDDMDQTWMKHPTSRSALRGPVCQASIIQFPFPKKDLDDYWLLFSNPNSAEARKNMTIKLSMDDGMTWPEKYQLLLNEKVGYGYSSLTAIDENTIGILYEGVGSLIFQKVNLSELTGSNGKWPNETNKRISVEE